MKKKLFFLLLLSLIITLTKVSLSQEIPDGPYFGQEAPGLTPQVFAPGIISDANKYEYNISFSPDGSECCFGVTNANWSWCNLYYTKYDSGKWSPISKAYFQKGYDGWMPFFTHDGEKFYFSSSRPGWPPVNTWMCDKTENGWSDPVKLDSPINGSSDDWRPTTTINKTFYFCAKRSGGFGNSDIYRSILTNNQYLTVENLGTPVNSSSLDGSPFISPDEKYLIFESWRPGGFGQGDLYISYLKVDSSWTKPQNLDSTMNTNQIEDGAYISPDGKYFFFNRRKAWNTNIDTDIHWVDSKIVFKPYVVTPVKDTSVIINENFQINIPSGTFNDYDDDSLFYFAVLSNGDSLPTWLNFEATTLTFTGKPTRIDTFKIKVTVVDSIGSRTSDEFLITVSDSINTSIINKINKINEFKLSQNFPNPFNPITTIFYSIPDPTYVILNIYNIIGQKIKTLINQFQKPGNYSVDWDGTNSNGKLVSSGIYLYKIITHNKFAIKRMVLLR